MRQLPATSPPWSRPTGSGRRDTCCIIRSAAANYGWLGEILVRIEREKSMRLVRATDEEEALAIACAPVGGVRTALFMQNAGLLSMSAGMVTLAQRYHFRC